MDFLKKLESAIKKNNSLLCIGLDTDINRLPDFLKASKDPIFEFNKQIIDKTYNLVCSYKPQIAYYAAYGTKGINALKKTVDYIHKYYPHIGIILDAKRADIGSTSEKYTQEVFDFLGVDAVTLNPYLGFDSLEPFLKRKDKGCIILCRTSNPGASDFQDLKVDNIPLYLKVAQKVVEWNKLYGNCLLVAGGTWPEEIKQIRSVAEDLFFLVPGIGSQNGNLSEALKAGIRKDKSGLIINVARDIIYQSSNKDFDVKARLKALSIKDEINQARY